MAALSADAERAWARVTGSSVLAQPLHPGIHVLISSSDPAAATCAVTVCRPQQHRADMIYELVDLGRGK